MKYLLTVRKIIIFCIICLPDGFAYGQTITNAGHEFWTVFPTHEQDVSPAGAPLPANLSLFITGSQSSSGKVTTGSFSTAFHVNANQVTEVQIPRTEAYISENQSGVVLHNRAIHVQTDEGQPAVVVYTHIFAGHRSAASLILPQEALGQQYFSINFPQHDTEGKNFIVVTAAEPNTKVHFLKDGQELITGGITLPYPGDVYEFLSTDDLSGVNVVVDKETSSCNHIAVFSGSSGIYIAPSTCTPTSLDPLFQQCPPLESWGYQYGFVPFSSQSEGKEVRAKGDFIRVLAKADETVVKINGTIVKTLRKGEFYTSPAALPAPAFITANNPICVAQYALSQSCSGGGYSDPDMVILNPLEYRINDITVYSSTRENISEQYLNILISKQAAKTFKINGVVPSQAFSQLGPGQEYAYMQLSLPKNTSNTYHLTAAEGFNAIAYGFGNVESYAYSAGTNLAAAQTLGAYSSATDIPIDSACVDDNYYFKLILPYRASQLSWQMDEHESPEIQISPSSVQIVTNGLASYEYRHLKTPAYASPGKHQIHILATYPQNQSGCNGGLQQIDGNFLVLAPPKASFTYTLRGCDNSLLFADHSVAGAPGELQRLWDFGDPNAGATLNTSTLSNPIHTFTAPGDYTVSILVTNASGCQSTFFSHVKIGPFIKPVFSNSTPGCADEAFYFNDETKANVFSTEKRKWFFGDGDSLTTTSSEVNHQYRRGGTYQAKLVLFSAAGCKSDTAVATITIKNKVYSYFDLPVLCLSNAHAHFVNKSIGHDYQAHSISYQWDFGDPFATSGNPNTSIVNDGDHIYTRAGNYTVTLVSLTDECTDTLRQVLTVNGEAPKAAFIISNPAVICYNDPVLLKDNSQPPIDGKISRITWYFDAGDDRNNKLTIDNPTPGNNYSTILEQPAAQVNEKTYIIRMLAFSGEGCVDSVSKEIRVQALPRVIFDPLPTVCVEAAPFLLTQAHETEGQSGTGVYHGPGVTTDGSFNPAMAGIGLKEISYTFTSAYGCQVTKKQQIQITPPPMVVMPDKTSIFVGQSILLEPHYSGIDLQYNWKAAPGLTNTSVPYPLVSPKETTTYEVTVSGGGCEKTGTIEVSVRKPIITETVFTPNGDGVNDTWEISNLSDYPGSSVEIFNRYGVSLFYSRGYLHQWDGRYKGTPVPAGVYYYVIRLGNIATPVSGYLTLIR